MSQNDPENLDTILKSAVCEAPKELLSGYRSIAIQTTLAFLLVMGWILTNAETQEIIRHSVTFTFGSIFGLIISCAAAVSIQFSYLKRSEEAFRSLRRHFGKDADVLKCYEIGGWQFKATMALIVLLALICIFQLLCVTMFASPPPPLS